MTDYKPHEYADYFPKLSQRELKELADDIRENGQLDPIIIDEDDLILDGRHRMLACAMAEVDPWIESFKGSDKLAFVCSKNVMRRHLSESDRAMIANRISTARRGAPEGNTNRSDSNAQECAIESKPAVVTQSEAAEMMNVSRRLVQSAHKVEEQGADELKDAVAKGEVTVTDAASIADKPKSVQKKAVKAKKAGKAKTVKKAAAQIAPEPAKPKMKTLKDVENHPVPQRLFKAFEAREHFIVARRAHGALGDALMLASRELPAGLVEAKEIDRLLAELYRKIEKAEPHIVCQKCMGDGVGCKPCGGYGFTRTGGQS